MPIYYIIKVRFVLKNALHKEKQVNDYEIQHRVQLKWSGRLYTTPSIFMSHNLFIFNGGSFGG